MRLGISGMLWLVAVAVMSVGCSAAGGSPSATGELRVVASTTVFADIVGAIGGDHVTVDSIVPAGSGPEDYEPRPEDARRISEADLIVSNGVGLDDFLVDIIDAAGSATAERLVLGDGIPTITVDGEQNPHFWLDPSLVEQYYVPAIRETLVRLVPSAKTDIEGSASAFATSLRELDEASRAKLAAIPAERRRLVTFHDAFPYFAAHYGFELVGVILENPGQEPSAADLAALVRTVKDAGVTAVFSEAQFDPKLAQTLAEEAGITKVVTTLYNDSLGPAPADTYIGLMTWDVDEIVKALR
ncbi:MAG TPA: metal ABC transporter substrate-binding protein [Candidatus Limnocylindrales bacterium]|nr:metal ABC transporter substrate-binding protein [Candidatus Limnocylindrales bacterium]